MKRKCLHASPCPIARALDSIGDWWTLLILRDAFEGVKRFNAIQKSLGIPRNILTTRLRMLVERDILSIAPASDGSVYREYVLTEKGQDLIPVLTALRQWGERHLASADECAEDADPNTLRNTSQGDVATVAMHAADTNANVRAHVGANVNVNVNAGHAANSDIADVSEDELADALEQVLLQTTPLHIEANRFIGPVQPHAAH